MIVLQAIYVGVTSTLTFAGGILSTTFLRTSSAAAIDCAMYASMIFPQLALIGVLPKGEQPDFNRRRSIGLLPADRRLATGRLRHFQTFLSKFHSVRRSGGMRRRTRAFRLFQTEDAFECRKVGYQHNSFQEHQPAMAVGILPVQAPGLVHPAAHLSAHPADRHSARHRLLAQTYRESGFTMRWAMILIV